MTNILVNVYNGITNETILIKEYSDETHIHTIKKDILTMYPLQYFVLCHNTIQLYDYMIISQISNEKELTLILIKHENEDSEKYAHNFIVYLKKGAIILDLCRNDYYICKNLNILKIYCYYCSIKCVVNKLYYILTTDYKLYLLKKISNSYNLKLINNNIKNIFIINHFIINITTDGIVKLISKNKNKDDYYNKNYNININNILNINNIKNINNHKNILYIETFNNMLIIIYDLIAENELKIIFENIKKIVYTEEELLILTDDGKLHSIHGNYDNILHNKKTLQ